METPIINLDNFCCNVLKCTYARQWDFGEGDCTSCELVGQSYTINQKPVTCIHSKKVDEEIERQRNI